MKRKNLVYWLCLGGIAVSLILLPIARLDGAIAKTHTNRNKELIARSYRPELQKPGGSNGNLEGGILLPESSISSEKPGDGSFVAQFTNKVNFQVQVWDPEVGPRNGDGIESVTFRISDENGNLVHEKVEIRAAYCPFGGGEPRCNTGQLANNHKYRVQIEVKPGNPSRQGAFWFFQIRT